VEVRYGHEAATQERSLNKTRFLAFWPLKAASGVGPVFAAWPFYSFLYC
jgi:hypothetical protein